MVVEVELALAAEVVMGFVEAVFAAVVVVEVVWVVVVVVGVVAIS